MFFKRNCFTFYNVKVWTFLSEFCCVIFPSMWPSRRPLEAVALLQQAREGRDIWSLNLKEHRANSAAGCLTNMWSCGKRKQAACSWVNLPINLSLFLSASLLVLWSEPPPPQDRRRTKSQRDEKQSNLLLLHSELTSGLRWHCPPSEGRHLPLISGYSTLYLALRLFGAREPRWFCLEGWPCCLSKGVHVALLMLRDQGHQDLWWIQIGCSQDHLSLLYNL